MKKSVREEALTRLDFLIGTWVVEVIPPPQTKSIYCETIFDWMEKEKFIVQRTLMNQPEFPGSTIVYDYDVNTNKYLQHYFDSRGVARLYNMSFEDDVLRLWRDTSDFSPLEFRQRFIGEINESRDTIHSSWQKSFDGLNWEHDFKLIYTKVI